MEKEFTKKINAIGGSLCVTIPKEIAELLNLKEDDFVTIKIYRVEKE